MKTDELLYKLMDKVSEEEVRVVDKMANFDTNLNRVHQRRIEHNTLKRQEKLIMDRIAQEQQLERKSNIRFFGKRKFVLLVATFILMIGMVGFGKEHDWDIQMADMLGFSDVMEELDGGYVKVDVSDTSDKITVTASQLIGDKNCMWVQLDTDVPWTVEEGGYYLFGDSNADCYCQSTKQLTGAQTFESFNHNGYISFMWQFEDYSDINRATIEIYASQLVEYKPLENEEDEQVTNVISDGIWELKWENCYAANTINRYPFKTVTLEDGEHELDCIIREIEISPISIQIKGWKNPLDDISHTYNLLEAVKLKDGTVIPCSSSVGGVSNFTVEAFLSKDYVPEFDMTEIEYVIIGGEDIKVAK